MRKMLAMAAALAAVLMLTGTVAAQGKKGFGKGGFGGLGLLGDKGVQKDLKLSDEQISRLDQLQVQQGGAMALVFNPKVKEKLDLNQEQTEKIQEIMKEAGPKFKEIFAGFKEDKEAATQKMAELNKSLLEDAMKVLNADQKKTFEEMRGPPAKTALFGPDAIEKNLDLTEEQTKRLGQLRIQQQGARAILSSKVKDKLDLSQDQVEKIQQLMKDSGPKFKEAFGGFKEASQEEKE